jgi:hypothetical protein
MERRAWLAPSVSIVIVALFVAACGSDAGDERPFADEFGGESALAITLVEFGDSTGAGGTVKVTNLGDGVAQPGSFQLCQQTTCVLVPAAPLQPGASMWLSSDVTRAVDSGEQGHLVWEPGLAMFDAAGGEFSLHHGLDIGSGDGESLPTVDWDEVEPALISYVAWGTSDQVLAPAAARAGLWTEGGTVDSAGATKIFAPTDAPTDPADWQITVG